MSQVKKHLIKKIVSKAKQEEKLDRLDKIVMALVAGGIILAGLYILLNGISNPKEDITVILPATKTAGFIEVENLSLPAKLAGQLGFSQETWKNALEIATGIPAQAISKVWDKGSFGIALILNESNVSFPVFFADAGSRRNVLKAFETLGVPGEKPIADSKNKNAVYSFPQGQTFYFTFAGSFVLMATQADILRDIQMVQGSDQGIAVAQPDYQKTAEQLPKNSWIKGYANVHNIYLKDRFLINNFLEPLKFAVNHVGFTVRQNPNGFHFNTFVNVNKKLLDLTSEKLGQSKFAHRLTDITPAENLGTYFGGENLSDEWQNTLSTIANLNPAYGIILESILRAQVTKIFGEKVDMRNDIYPLFEGEYGLMVGSKDGGGKTISLVLSHDDKAFAQIKMDKLLDGFQLLAAEFTPKIHTVLLPDGTESRELVANDEIPREEVEEVANEKIHCVEVEDSPTAFCYAITDTLLVMSNSRANVAATLALTAKDDGSLSAFQPFRTTLNSVSQVTDEITFINLPNTLSLMEGNNYLMLAKPFLEGFEAIAWVKHYFEDGVSTDGYLLLK